MSFPRYAEYKPSGVEWLGEVPAHWQAKRMSHLFGLIASGTTPSTDDSDSYNGDTPWVTTGELREDFIEATEKAVTAAALKKYSALRVYSPGTLLMAMYGATIGRLGILRVEACTNQACCAFAEPQSASVRYMFYALLAARDHLLLIASGGGQPNVNQDKLRSLRVAAPPLDEQTAIAAFLDLETAKIDALVAEQQKLIALLKEKRQAVISHAVTKGLNPNAPMTPSGIEWLGDVPAHWALLRLKEFTSFSGGGTPSRDDLTLWNGDIPWVSPKDMKSERIIGAEEKITQAGLDASASNLIGEGQLLMVVRSGILKHTIPVGINAAPVAMNQDMKALHFKTGTCLSAFFLRWTQGLNSILLHAWAKQGATVESIEHDNLANTLVPLPPVDEQTAIATFLDHETAKIDTLIAEADRITVLLKERRSALISAAVTGQIDVRETIDMEAP